jgi:glycosyltransferase involved in cell wall biosynthesis
LVLDDGSTDRTAAVARELGATHVLELPHRGLAQTFMTGVRYALARGAHTVVNFDADNQYSADDIATITAPIVEGDAGVVIGERPLRSIERLHPFKRRLHLAGNAFLRWLTGTAVTDASSGFRALRHDVACLLEIRSTYTYTIEMLLEFSLAGVAITFVPVRVTSQDLRPSRLIKSNAEYLFKNSCIIVRTLVRNPRLPKWLRRPAPVSSIFEENGIRSPVADSGCRSRRRLVEVDEEAKLYGTSDDEPAALSQADLAG